MAIFDPYGRDRQNPLAAPSLPTAPPSIAAGAVPSFNAQALPAPEASGLQHPAQLPVAPPAKRASAFDDDNYRQTMLALSAGFFGSPNLAEGLGKAASTIYGRNEALNRRAAPEIGGPDNAFEVYTDPQTGEKSYKPIQAFVDYQRDKRVDPADASDLTGRTMYAIGQLPEEERAAAYQEVINNPQLYGIRDTSAMPAAYDPRWVQMATDRGMTVSQALTRDQQALNGQSAADARTAAQGTREEALALARRRAEATIRQGDARVGIAERALAQRGKGSASGKADISGLSDAELLALVF